MARDKSQDGMETFLSEHRCGIYCQLLSLENIETVFKLILEINLILEKTDILFYLYYLKSETLIIKLELSFTFSRSSLF